MKTFKKALSIFLIVSLLVTLFVGPARATEDTTNSFTVTVGEAEAIPGDTVDVTVDLSEVNGGYRALDFAITYDGPISLTNVKCEDETTYDGTQGEDVESLIVTTSEHLTDTPYVMQWAYVTSANVTYAGKIATLTFKVADDATAGTVANVNIAAYNKDGSLDINGNPVAVEYVNGTVTVKEEEPECEHDYTITNNTATKDAAGTATKVCSKCGDTIETYFPRIVRFAAVTLVLQDNISIKFKADAKYLTSFGGDYEALYCKFVLDGQEYTVTDYEIENPDTTKPRAVFTFSKLKSYQMGLDVNATVYGVYNGEHLDGQGITNSVLNYGVYSYCNSKFKENVTNDDDIKFNTLLADLINYGDVSQRFNNQYLEEGLVSTLVPAGLLGYKTTEERTYTKTSNTKVEEIENPSYRFRAVGLVTEAAIVMRLRVDNYEYKTIGSMDSRDDFVGLAFKVSCDGKEWVFKPDEMTDEEFNSRFQPHPEGGYYFLFNGLVSYQFSSDVNFIICRNDESLTPLSNTLGYSIEAYATSKVGGSDAALTEMCRAIMNFGDSAAKYF